MEDIGARLAKLEEQIRQFILRSRQEVEHGQPFYSLVFGESSMQADNPTSSIDESDHDHYKLLLRLIADSLLNKDVIKLKKWADENFPGVNPPKADVILSKLDQEGTISASNLSHLRVFFESILRIDVVCMIDFFVEGDYSELHSVARLISREGRQADGLLAHFLANRLDVELCGDHRCREKSVHEERSVCLKDAITGGESLQTHKVDKECSSQMIQKDPTRCETSNSHEDHPPYNSLSQLISKNLFASEVEKLNRWANQELSVDPANSSDILSQLNASNLCQIRDFLHSIGKMELVYAIDFFVEGDYSVLKTGLQLSNELIKKSENLTSKRKDRDGQNGNRETSRMWNFFFPKFVKANEEFWRRAVQRLSRQSSVNSSSEFFCPHYRRNCQVKFECCESFWPCHHCHNNKSVCGRKGLESRDTKMVKCGRCSKVQQVSQFCSHCHEKFAEYYCGPCKHLSGMDDDPYHCDKCGICRLHRGRSFHCDTRGVCLDERQRDESAFDECCICLEDAFTGVQLLPCGHRVHRECANQLMRNGITRCPICRKSIAKGGQSSTTNSRKRGPGH